LQIGHSLNQEHSMTLQQGTGGDGRFWIGMFTGGLIGAGLAIVFAPQLATEVRKRINTTAADLGEAASSGYQQVSTRVANVVDGVTARGQAVRDDVADAVGRGAREVEQIAMAAKSPSGPRRS
jgi:gas vesicle protein